jgi:hypothetical protein
MPVNRLLAQDGFQWLNVRMDLFFANRTEFTNNATFQARL